MPDTSPNWKRGEHVPFFPDDLPTIDGVHGYILAQIALKKTTKKQFKEKTACKRDVAKFISINLKPPYSKTRYFQLLVLKKWLRIPMVFPRCRLSIVIIRDCLPQLLKAWKRTFELIQCMEWSCCSFTLSSINKGTPNCRLGSFIRDLLEIGFIYPFSHKPLTCLKGSMY